MNTTLIQVFGPIIGLAIVIFFIKGSIGYLVGKDQKGVHGDIARTIVKKARGNPKKPSVWTRQSTGKYALGRLRKFLFGP